MTEESLNWQDKVGNTMTVRVIPKASTNRIKPESMPDGTLRIRVYVTVVAESGKANEMMLKLLAKSLGLPKSAISIIKGQTSQDKIVQITR